MYSLERPCRFHVRLFDCKSLPIVPLSNCAHPENRHNQHVGWTRRVHRGSTHEMRRANSGNGMRLARLPCATSITSCVRSTSNMARPTCRCGGHSRACDTRGSADTPPSYGWRQSCNPWLITCPYVRHTTPCSNTRGAKQHARWTRAPPPSRHATASSLSCEGGCGTE